MLSISLHGIGCACLAFCTIGFIEIAIGLLTAKTYNLLRAIIYSMLFGIGIALL